MRFEYDHHKNPFSHVVFRRWDGHGGLFREHGGAVLSTTFDKYCYVNVRHLPRSFEYTSELSYSIIERILNRSDIKHPLIRNAMDYLDIHDIRLSYEADLPARSGLGRSSSFAVGIGSLTLS